MKNYKLLAELMFSKHLAELGEFVPMPKKGSLAKKAAILSCDLIISHSTNVKARVKIERVKKELIKFAI